MTTAPLEWNWAAPGCLPNPTTSIFVQPLSIGPRNWVCGLIRLTGMTRSAPAAWTSRCSGRPRTSWATTTVSIDERISQSRASAVMPSLASVASWPSAVAPPWLPIAGTTNGAAPRSRSPAMAPRSSSTCAVKPRLPAPTATVIPSSTAPASARTTSSRAAPSTSATAGGSGTGSSMRVSRGTVIDGSIGSTTPAWSWSHPTTPTVRGSLGVVDAEDRFVGEIAGAGTTSGTRLVIGHWPTSPFGPIADAMVEDADGHRVLHRAEPGGRFLHRRRLRVRRRRRHRRRRHPRTRAAAVPRRPARRRARRRSARRTRLGAARRAARHRHQPDVGVRRRPGGPHRPAWRPDAGHDAGRRRVLRGDRPPPHRRRRHHVGRRRPRPAGGRRPTGALRLQLRSAATIDRGRDDDGGGVGRG